jgi:hypothetical protein
MSDSCCCLPDCPMGVLPPPLLLINCLSCSSLGGPGPPPPSPLPWVDPISLRVHAFTRFPVRDQVLIVHTPWRMLQRFWRLVILLAHTPDGSPPFCRQGRQGWTCNPPPTCPPPSDLFCLVFSSLLLGLLLLLVKLLLWLLLWLLLL